MQKKIFFPIIFLFLLLSLRTTSTIIFNPKKTAGIGNTRTFAVVELFTSEGCSSCPSADKAVEELHKDYPDNVFVLAFHVDYWNRLGWKDEFSKSEFTARQNLYASQFNLQSIYTPQVVINGQYEFVGSDKTKLYAATKSELAKESGNQIELSSSAGKDHDMTVHFKVKDITGAALQIALVQNEAITSVKRGENAGRKLHHINIVRDFKTSEIQTGSVNLHFPHEANARHFTVIAFVQNKNGEITAVTKIAAGK